MDDLAGYLRTRLNPNGVPSPVWCPRRGDFGRQQLAAVFGLAGFRRGAEIGVAGGKFSEVLCANIPSLDTLFCVDPWAGYRGNARGGTRPVHRSNYASARRRLKPYPAARLVRAMSLDVAADVEPASLDFVYIDANHDFDFVMQDVIVWASKVRPGGIVSGDDYYEFRHAGVIAAVNAYTAAHGIDEWYLTGNWSRSWFWVKT